MSLKKYLYYNTREVGKAGLVKTFIYYLEMEL